MSDQAKPANETNSSPSKSQRRRDALTVRSLAAELIGLEATALERIPLGNSLRTAIAEARRIRSRVARKRQLQYVAKLLRRSEVEPIFHALDAIRNEARQLGARQHRVEQWRDVLLEHGDPAVGQLAVSRRDTDIQAVRQLLRNARQEACHGKPPVAARSLFRLLREMDECEALPPANTKHAGS